MDDLSAQTNLRSTSPSPDALKEPPAIDAFRSRLERFSYAGSPEKRTTATHLSKSSRSTMTPEKDTDAKGPSSTALPSQNTGRLTRSSLTELTRASSKRRMDDPESPSSSATSGKRRSTTKERSAKDPYHPENKLVDSLDDDLVLMFVGLNPGLQTAATGHAYSHPSNLFWKILYNSGITPIKHSAKDTYDMVKLYRIGNTNLCSRPTRAGDGLTQTEQEEGVGTIEAKVWRYKPEAVCIVGKGIWEVMYKVKTGKRLKKEDFKWGWQDEDLWLGRQVDERSNVTWEGARTFVATTTSGLAASMTPDEKLAV